MNHILQEDARDILKQDISWENFDGKRILVTGAGGMLGSYISRTILQWKEISGNDLELYALVRHPEKLPEDVRDQVKVLRQSVAEPIQTDVDFHYIIHAASPASPLIMREDPVGRLLQILWVLITPWIWHAEVMQRGICLFLLVKSMDSPTMIRKNLRKIAMGL